MTGSVQNTTRQRPSTSLRRALWHEWRRRRDLFALYGTFMTVALLCAIHLDFRLGVVLILLAVRLPADLADPVLEDGMQLRSSLGISRADAVRARTLLVSAGQLLLALGAAGVILLSDWAPGAQHWSSLGIVTANDDGSSPPALWDHLVDIGLFSGAIAWTHALIGGDAFRLGARMTGRRAVVWFLGVCLLIYLALVGSMLLTSGLLLSAGADDDLGTRFVIAERVAQGTALLLTLGGGITALVLRYRRWVRRA
ncbi:MAG: hypothetical protein ACTHWV_00470 [Brachybacterium sp.]